MSNGLIHFNLPKKPPCAIKVIGVGGTGCKVANELYRRNLPNTSFAALDTDSSLLESLSIPIRTHIILEGDKTSIQQNNKIPENIANDINYLLEDDTQLNVIVGCLGGNAATNIIPIITHITKERQTPTIVIVTIPFLFEGFEKANLTLDSLEVLEKRADALLVFSNERLREVNALEDIGQAFQKTRTSLAKCISDLIGLTSYKEDRIPFSVKSLIDFIRGGRIAVMSTATSHGNQRMTKAIDAASRSPLLNHVNLSVSAKILLDFSYGNELKMPEMDEIQNFTKQLPETTEISWHLHQDKKLGDNLKINLLASGFTLNDIYNDLINDATSSKFSDNEINRFCGKTRFRKAFRPRENNAKVYNIYTFIPSTIDDEDIIAMVDQSPTYSRNIATLNAIRRRKNHTDIFSPKGITIPPLAMRDH